VGRDALAELTQPGKPPVLSYRFFFAGIPGDPLSPEMTLSLDGPSSERAALDAAWDHWLGSVRPVPAR
jgi:hypothetical protein